VNGTGIGSLGIADVVTSFDALEHLLPEEVDEVLDEMRRIAVPGGRFIISICTRESKTKVNGEGLHPTVRPIKWWLDRVGLVGTVRQGLGAPRYIAGVFNHA
jgi:SAM-dependent methyltransferase